MFNKRNMTVTDMLLSYKGEICRVLYFVILNSIVLFAHTLHSVSQSSVKKMVW